MRHHCLLLVFAACALACHACTETQSALAQVRAPQRPMPTPASVIGHEVGADYKLARWEKIVTYFEALAAASDRVALRRIGTSTEGNPLLLCVISSASTIQQLDKYQQYQAMLADPRLITDDARRAALLAEAKTTIIVTCSLHSNEVAASQMSMELAYDLASQDDPKTREILDNCIILLVPSANPDGNNKIVGWYEKYLGTPYEGGMMPWLYQKYAGHDNNRDWFMLNLKETRILTDVLYRQWHPTILYDIHQMGNRHARFFVPPFFDPVNPNVDPLIHQSLLIIGGHMATELQERNKTGVVFKAIFDNWWQGGNRTTPYRHNVIGILTEAASAKVASPIFQRYRELRAGGRGMPQYAPAVNFPEPWPGGWWRLRDIVEYETIACRALFTLAARYRDRFVRNHLSLSEKALRLGREEPPFAWLIPPDQRDPGAAAVMLERLRLTGIEVHVATKPFKADNVSYPTGTHVLLAEQPYRPHLKDMMERQDYPDRRQYPDGPAESPYDSAGWTLPLQMGVKSVEVVLPFEASLQRVNKVAAKGHWPADAAPSSAFVTRRHRNADYTAVNMLLADGFKVSVLSEEHEGYPVGSLVVTSGEKSNALSNRIRKIAETIPASFERIATMPGGDKLRSMSAPRTALYQPWFPSMDEGWTRYVLEEFGFPFATIHNAEVRAGNLRQRFDCIILPDLSARMILKGISDKDMPPPYAGGIGDDGAMALERFVQQGGTLVLMDSATQLATELYRTPVRNVLKQVPADKFFCPGSILRIRVDNKHPLGYGFDTEAAAFFARSQAFDIGRAALTPKNQGETVPEKATHASATRTTDASTPALSDEQMSAKLAAQPTTSVATYSDNIVLLSGWILGEDRLRDRTAICEVGYGQGRMVLLGFRVQHRGQPHGTFKFLFNSIYRSTLQKEPTVAIE